MASSLVELYKKEQQEDFSYKKAWDRENKITYFIRLGLTRNQAILISDSELPCKSILARVIVDAIKHEGVMGALKKYIGEYQGNFWAWRKVYGEVISPYRLGKVGEQYLFKALVLLKLI